MNEKSATIAIKKDFMITLIKSINQIFKEGKFVLSTVQNSWAKKIMRSCQVHPVVILISMSNPGCPITFFLLWALDLFVLVFPISCVVEKVKPENMTIHVDSLHVISNLQILIFYEMLLPIKLRALTLVTAMLLTEPKTPELQANISHN